MNENATKLSRRDLTSIKGFDPVLPELGKIKIGEKGQRRKSKKSNVEFQPPQKLDHFKVVGLERGPDNNLLIDKKLHEVVGPKPRELDIVFPYNDIALNFVTFYAHYSSRTCQCKGNGEVAFRLKQAGEYEQIKCNPESCPLHNPPEPKNKNERRANAVCKPNGILSVILMKAPRIGGVYKFRTTSYNTVRNLLSSLQMIRQLTGGTLAGIPLKLTLKPQTVTPKGMTGGIVVYVVSVEWPGTIDSLYAKALESASLRAKSLTDLRDYEDQARKALTSGPDENEDEIIEVTEEFYPEAVEAELVEDSDKPETATEPPKPPEDAEAQAPKEKAGGPISDDNVPPLDAYEEDGTPPPDDLMDDAAPRNNSETKSPEGKGKDENGGNAKANKSKRRRI